MSKTVGIVGTLDTKGTEFKFLKNQIEGGEARDLLCAKLLITITKSY